MISTSVFIVVCIRSILIFESPHHLSLGSVTRPFDSAYESRVVTWWSSLNSQRAIENETR